MDRMNEGARPTERLAPWTRRALVVALLLALTATTAPSGAAPANAGGTATATAEAAPIGDVHAPTGVDVAAARAATVPRLRAATASGADAATPAAGASTPATVRADAAIPWSTAPGPGSTRQGVILSPANDYCGDATTPADTWNAYIQQQQEGLVFATRTCAAFDPARDLGLDGAVRFALNANLDGDGLDYIVGFLHDADQSSGLEVLVLRTPVNTDQSTWTSLYEAPALQVAPNEFGALIPAATLPLSQFFYLHTMLRGDQLDDMPELEEAATAAAIHPNGCAGFGSGAASTPTTAARTTPTTTSVRGPAGPLASLADALQAAGVTVQQANLDLGFIGVNLPADDPALAVATRAAGLTTRPALAMAPFLVPSDARFGEQWAHEQVGSAAAWDVVTRSDHVVAVVDSGVDTLHPDLLTSQPYDAVNGHPSTQPSNARGFHGSAVASVVGARGDNGVNGAGVTWDHPVMAINAFDTNSCSASTWIAEGIRAATDQGARIINLSLGAAVGTSDPDVDAAIAHATSRGVIIVAASGNSGAKTVSYPASHPDVIAVGATNRAGGVPQYSQTGAALDVVAPGGGDEHTDAELVYVSVDNGGDGYISGTSFAAPMVAGAAALWLQVRGGQGTPEEFRADLHASARDIGAPGRDDQTGHGVLDLPALLGLADVTPDLGALDLVEATSPAALSTALAARRATAATPTHAILARDDVFADSLAGTGLAAGGPLLFTPGTALDPGVRDSLATLPDGATVYLLGGEQALAPAVADGVADLGLVPVRLAGPGRVETALAIAEEVATLHPDGSAVAIARADDWADSVAAGTWAAQGHPVLITGRDALHPAVAEWLAQQRPATVHVLGGTAAISDQVLTDLRTTLPASAVARVAGSTRDGTAEAVAQQLLPGHRRVAVIPGWHAQGWVPGLATGALGGVLDVAIGLAGDTVPDSTGRLVTARSGCAEVSVHALDGQLPGSSLGEVARLAGCT